MSATPPDSPLRVVVFGPTHPFKGGVAQHTTTLAHQLVRRGHTVDLVSWSRPYPERLYPGQLTVEVPEIDPFGSVERTLSWNRPDTWLAAGRRHRGADVAVFAHVVPVQAVPYRVSMAALGSGPRRTVLCHNVIPHERHPGDRMLVSGLLRPADRVLVHSADQAALAAGLAGGRVPVVAASLPPNFPDAFTARRPQAGEHRRILFFGIVRPYKGVDVLLRALAAGPPGVRLRIAGEVWGGLEALRSLCAELGVEDRVELMTGYIDATAVPDLFADVDALVLPYREATGSQAVWTGFQFGVPVIATRTGELAAAVTEGVDGLVAEPGEVDSLAAALHELYRPGRAEQLRAGVQPVDVDARWSLYLDRLLGGAHGRPERS